MLTRQQLDQLKEVLDQSEGTTRIQWSPDMARELVSLAEGLIEAVFYFAQHDSKFMVEATVNALQQVGYGKQSTPIKAGDTLYDTVSGKPVGTALPSRKVTPAVRIMPRTMEEVANE